MSSSHPLSCRASSKLVIGRHNAAVRCMMRTFQTHNIAVNVEVPVADAPALDEADSAVPSGRARYGVRLDLVGWLPSHQNFRVDFTCSDTVAPSYLLSALIGKLPAHLEQNKLTDYNARAKPSSASQRAPDFIPAAVNTVNQWGRRFEDFMAKMEKLINHGQDVHSDENRAMPKRFSVQWMRARIGATLARYNHSIIQRYVRLAQNKILNAARHESLFLSNAVANDVPGEADVLDSDYAVGPDDGLDPEFTVALS
jgi:hypothetical protein